MSGEKNELVSEAKEASDYDGECAICLNEFASSTGDAATGRVPQLQKIGTPESCDHNFCLLCLQEWARNTNTCPVDRSSFNLVFVREAVNGPIIRKVKIRDTELELSDEEDEDRTFCEECGQADREHTLLLCDGCDCGYHMECLTPPLSVVPDDEWFCVECAASRTVVVETGAAARRRRRVPRTEQAERVRQRIARILDDDDEEMEEEGSGEDNDEEEEMEEVETDEEEQNSEHEPTTEMNIDLEAQIAALIDDDLPESSTPSRAPKRRVSSSPKRPAPKKRRVVKRRKTKKRKTKKRRKYRRTRRGRRTTKGKATFSGTSPGERIRNRLTTKLGVAAPAAGHFLPKSTAKATGGAGAATAAGASGGASTSGSVFSPLYLFGNDKGLPAFADDDSEDDDGALLSRNARRFDQPIRRQNKGRPSRQPEQLQTVGRVSTDAGDQSATPTTPVGSEGKQQPQVADTDTSGGDILGSIFATAEVLFAPAKHVKINADGSLSARDSLKEHKEKVERRKLKIKGSNNSSLTGSSFDAVSLTDATPGGLASLRQSAVVRTSTDLDTTTSFDDADSLRVTPIQPLGGRFDRSAEQHVAAADETTSFDGADALAESSPVKKAATLTNESGGASQKQPPTNAVAVMEDEACEPTSTTTHDDDIVKGHSVAQANQMITTIAVEAPIVDSTTTPPHVVVAAAGETVEKAAVSDGADDAGVAEERTSLDTVKTGSFHVDNEFERRITRAFGESEETHTNLDETESKEEICETKSEAPMHSGFDLNLSTGNSILGRYRGEQAARSWDEPPTIGHTFGGQYNMFADENEDEAELRRAQMEAAKDFEDEQRREFLQQMHRRQSEGDDQHRQQPAEPPRHCQHTHPSRLQQTPPAARTAHSRHSVAGAAADGRQSVDSSSLLGAPVFVQQHQRAPPPAPAPDGGSALLRQHQQQMQQQQQQKLQQQQQQHAPPLASQDGGNALLRQHQLQMQQQQQQQQKQQMQHQQQQLLKQQQMLASMASAVAQQRSAVTERVQFPPLSSPLPSSGGAGLFEVPPHFADPPPPAPRPTVPSPQQQQQHQQQLQQIMMHNLSALNAAQSFGRGGASSAVVGGAPPGPGTLEVPPPSAGGGAGVVLPPVASVASTTELLLQQQLAAMASSQGAGGIRQPQQQGNPAPPPAVSAAEFLQQYQQQQQFSMQGIRQELFQQQTEQIAMPAQTAQGIVQMPRANVGSALMWQIRQLQQLQQPQQLQLNPAFNLLVQQQLMQQQQQQAALMYPKPADIPLPPAPIHPASIPLPPPVLNHPVNVPPPSTAPAKPPDKGTPQRNVFLSPPPPPLQPPPQHRFPSVNLLSRTNQPLHLAPPSANLQSASFQNKSASNEGNLPPELVNLVNEFAKIKKPPPGVPPPTMGMPPPASAIETVWSGGGGVRDAKPTPAAAATSTRLRFADDDATTAGTADDVSAAASVDAIASKAHGKTHKHHRKHRHRETAGQSAGGAVDAANSASSRRTITPSSPSTVDNSDELATLADMEAKLSKAERKRKKREKKAIAEENSKKSSKRQLGASLAPATSTTADDDDDQTAIGVDRAQLPAGKSKYVDLNSSVDSDKSGYMSRVVEEMKVALLPYYSSRKITKDEYKDIMKRAVSKICKTKGSINPVKIRNFVEGYVEKTVKDRSKSIRKS